MEKFLKSLIEDADVRARFLKASTPEGAYNVAKPYVGGMSIEEFSDKMIALSEDIERKDKLSYNEIESVSGGSSQEAWQAIKYVGTLFLASVGLCDYRGKKGE